MIRYALGMIASLMLASSATAAPAVGKAAPAFSATDALSGKPVSLADFSGKTVVLEWNNYECPFVKKFYGSGTMQSLQKKAVADGVIWVTINSSAKEKQGHFADSAAAKKAATEQKSNASYYLLDQDGKIGHAYDAKTTPHMFVIDGKGTLVYAGAIDSNPTPDPADIAGATNYVTAAIAAVNEGKPVTPSNTKPYGCGVKY